MDRFDEIKERFSAWGSKSLGGADITWLIDELDRLRSYVFIDNADLTFALEELGSYDGETSLPILCYFLNHKNAVVREGALYGIGRVATVSDGVKDKIRTMSLEDVSLAVRTVAADVLEDLQ